MRKQDLSPEFIMQEARRLAGNWKEFDSFAWSGKSEIDTPENWAIVYTSNRDSTLIDQSNSAIIEKLMEPYTNEGEDGKAPDAIRERHNHWAVGYVDGYSIRCFDDAGNPTEAIKEWIGIQAAMADYPILDESDYSERECEATWENVQQQTSYICRKHDIKYSEDMANNVAEWLNEHKPGSLENVDDTGGFPDDDEIEEALEALGLLESVESES